jgi:hypothetical protein
MIKDYVCEHGVRHGGNENAEPVVWNGPVGTCECCGRGFTYLDSFNFSKAGSSGRSWNPKNRCGSCGGRYKEF